MDVFVARMTRPMERATKTKIPYRQSYPPTSSSSALGFVLWCFALCFAKLLGLVFGDPSDPLMNKVLRVLLALCFFFFFRFPGFGKAIPV